jgi:CheY-like chemotaxis protein
MKNIYLVEDNPFDAKFFTTALETIKMPVSLQHFEDGVELMNNLHDHALPDIIFLDINMPRKDGYECLLEIRASEKLNSVIVIIFSTSDNPTDIMRMYKAGANLYICKPYSYFLWKDVIEDAIVRTTNDKEQPALEKFLLK